jgi:hypothetical protein
MRDAALEPQPREGIERPTPEWVAAVHANSSG